MQRSLHIVTFLLIALLAVSAVSATMIVNKYTNDFSVESPYSNTVKACSCESRADPFTVTNTGSFVTTYSVDVLADQPWYRVSTDSFTLNPGESNTFIVYTEPPCGVTGQYTYSVRIASSYGRERVTTRTFDIRQCQNLFLTVDGGTNESNLCQPLTYNLTLKNVAEFADTFHLDFGSFNDYSDLAQRDYYLVPNKEKRLKVTITPPCSLYGDVAIPFIVASEKNKVTEQRTASVSIMNEFDHDIVIGTQDEACSQIQSAYTFSVKNNIDVPNSYDVIVDAPGFVSYDPKTLKLAGGEEKNVTLKLAPKKGQEGKYNIKVSVDSKLGDIKKTRPLELDVFDCFAFDAGFVDQQQDANGAYVDTACCGEKTYTLNIRNEGQTEETYDISVDGPSWFSPEERTIRLKPSENRNVAFTADIPCTDDSHEIPVTVSLTKHPEISETVTFRLESQTQQTCHAVETSVSKIGLNEHTDVVPFLIRNTGIAGGTYRVNLDSPLFGNVSEQRITLEPGEEKVLHLATRENLTDYFDGKYLSTLTLTYDPLNIDYAAPFWTRFSHDSWLVKAWRSFIGYDYANISPCVWVELVLALILVAAIIVLVVMSVRGKRPMLSAGALWTARVVLITAAIALLVAILIVPLPAKAALYEPTANDTTGLVFQWYENERMSVNLSQYFHDPDSDWLEYSASQPGHVSVSIDGETAVLLPEHNWAGQESVVFTATDQKGGYADSPLFTLRVLARKRLSVGQWLNRYCLHVNLVLLLLLALTLLGIVLLYEPRHGRVIQPPTRPGKAVRTIVGADGAVRKLGAAATPRAKQSARSRAMDAKLVACTQEHEMRTVLKAHGLRGTKGNVKRMQDACRRFKADRTRTHNRSEFYRWLAETGALTTFEGGAKAIRPGQEIVATTSRGTTRVIGRAERIEWPEPKGTPRAAAVGNVVNVTVPDASTKELVLVGAKNGNKVHDPQCIVAHRISRKNKVTFTSKAAASKAGYGPCKICQPFD